MVAPGIPSGGEDEQNEEWKRIYDLLREEFRTSLPELLMISCLTSLRSWGVRASACTSRSI